MSRIGKLPIHVPAGVTVTIKDNVVTVKGPKGEMTQAVNPDINVTLEDGIIHGAAHLGLSQSLVDLSS